MTRQKDTINLLKSRAQEKLRPDNSRYKAILLQDALHITDITGLSLFEVEKDALAHGLLPERYSRNQRTLSTSDQLELHLSTVAVIGLGGLGGTVTEILARIGVGRLILVDGDIFDESNLNRQLLSSPENLGVAKAKVAEKRVRELNPAIQIIPIAEFLTAQNSTSLLAGASLAIDCLDTIKDRFVLEDGCRKASIPLITAAIGGTSGQAMLIHPGDPGLKAIYGKKEKAPERGIEASMGTLPFAAIHMASIQCAEAVNLLLGKESSLRNKLLFTDVADHNQELILLQ